MKEDTNSNRLLFNGLVLAGGQSSRMGLDKAMLTFSDGETLMQRATALLKKVGAEQVFISSHNPRISSGLSDLFPGRGPVSGIHAALAHTGSTPLLVLPVDMPLMQPTLLRSLLNNGSSLHRSCCFTDQCLPLFIIEPEPALSRAEQLLSGAENVSVWRFIKAIDAIELETEVVQDFKNANDPQQWQECQALLK